MFAPILGVIVLLGCGPHPGPHQPLPEKPMTVSQAATRLSFEQILPILEGRCVRCHSAGELDWTNEENLRRVARSGQLAARLENHSMPQPGSPEAQSITSDEINTIIKWADQFAISPKEQ